MVDHQFPGARQHERAPADHAAAVADERRGRARDHHAIARARVDPQRQRAGGAEESLQHAVGGELAAVGLRWRKSERDGRRLVSRVEQDDVGPSPFQRARDGVVAAPDRDGFRLASVEDGGRAGGEIDFEFLRARTQRNRLSRSRRQHAQKLGTG